MIFRYIKNLFSKRDTQKKSINICDLTNYFSIKLKKLTYLELNALLAYFFMIYFRDNQNRFWKKKYLFLFHFNITSDGLVFKNCYNLSKTLSSCQQVPITESLPNLINDAFLLDLLEEAVDNFKDIDFKKYILTTYLIYYWYPMRLSEIHTFLNSKLLEHWNFIFYSHFVSHQIPHVNINQELYQLILSITKENQLYI